MELDPAAERELGKLDPSIARRIPAFLHGLVASPDAPRHLGEALKGSRLGDLWKYRVGDDRLIVSLEDETVRLLVVRLGHRRDLYRR